MSDSIYSNAWVLFQRKWGLWCHLKLPYFLILKVIKYSKTPNSNPFKFYQSVPQNLSYFDRILLKKCKDLEFDQFDQGTSERDLPSRQYSQHTDSPGELTISQLDFFNGNYRHIKQETDIFNLHLPYETHKYDWNHSCNPFTLNRVP